MKSCAGILYGSRQKGRMKMKKNVLIAYAERIRKLKENKEASHGGKKEDPAKRV